MVHLVQLGRQMVLSDPVCHLCPAVPLVPVVRESLAGQWVRPGQLVRLGRLDRPADLADLLDRGHPEFLAVLWGLAVLLVRSGRAGCTN